MTQSLDAHPPIRTSITATLSVRNGRDAITFYQSAFGAKVLHRIDDASGAVVAQMSVSDAEFWLADESPEHQNFSPMTLGGCSVRMLLIVDNPDEACRTACLSGATQIAEVSEGHGWRIGRIVDPFGHHWEIAKPIANG